MQYHEKRKKEGKEALLFSSVVELYSPSTTLLKMVDLRTRKKNTHTKEMKKKEQEIKNRQLLFVVIDASVSAKPQKKAIQDTSKTTSKGKNKKLSFSIPLLSLPAARQL